MHKQDPKLPNSADDSRENGGPNVRQNEAKNNGATQESVVVSGRIRGEALVAFRQLQADEGLAPGQAVVAIFDEWVRLKQGKPPLRFATVDSTKFNFVLGEVSALSRALKACQSALLQPRPVLPEDQKLWTGQLAEVTRVLGVVEQKMGQLFEVAKIHLIPKPDPKHLLPFIRIAWKDPELGKERDRTIRMVLRPWIGDPPPAPAPATPPAKSKEVA